MGWGARALSGLFSESDVARMILMLMHFLVGSLNQNTARALSLESIKEEMGWWMPSPSPLTTTTTIATTTTTTAGIYKDSPVKVKVKVQVKVQVKVERVVIGVHVRHSDSCKNHGGGSVRSCGSMLMSRYVQEIRAMQKLYATTRVPISQLSVSVFVATDDAMVLTYLKRELPGLGYVLSNRIDRSQT